MDNNTDTATRVLTMGDACTLADIIRAAQGGKRVRWLVDSGDVMEGVARSIGDTDGTFLRAGQDVRDGYLRISATFEHYLPVAEVIAKCQAGEFAID
jgi:hypothetical protein